MVAWIVGLLALVCAIAFICHRLRRSNLDPTTLAGAEKRLSEREALRFRIENGLPVK